jgi:hypothetical protein
MTYPVSLCIHSVCYQFDEQINCFFAGENFQKTRCSNVTTVLDCGLWITGIVVGILGVVGVIPSFIGGGYALIGMSGVITVLTLTNCIMIGTCFRFKRPSCGYQCNPEPQYWMDWRA